MSVVLVTGSSSGIGAATARRFAEAGHSVVLNSAKSVEAGEQLETELPGSLYVQADIAKGEDCTRLVGEVLERYGRLDVLINNAGVTKMIPHHDLEAATIDVWREIFEVNVFGTWSMSIAAIQALRASRGSIVNVSSVAGFRPSGSSIPYAASKAAVNHMTALLAKVVGPQVRVNAVAPGLVDTPWTQDWNTIRERVASAAPLKRTGLPDDIADVIVTLATTPYMTGQVVIVDGGLSLVT